MRTTITMIMLGSFLFLAAELSAAEISGPLSGLLPLSGSPYQVVGDIWVTNYLSIEPGVKFEFQGPYSFEIRRGTSLYAIGTETDSITFSCDTLLYPDAWMGIKTDSANVVKLYYCIVENAKQSGLWFRGQYNYYYSRTELTHCLISHNSSPDSLGIGGGATLQRLDVAIFSYNTFIANKGYDGGGIHLDFASVPILENAILNNEAFYGGGISTMTGCSVVGSHLEANRAVYGGAIFARSYSFVQANQITDNSATNGGGVMLRGGGRIFGNHVTRNSASTGYGGGISCGSRSNYLLRDNIIQDNAAEIGGGLAILDSATATMRRNQILGNSALSNGGGIYIDFSDPGVSLNSWYRFEMFQGIITGNLSPRFPAAFIGGPILVTIANNTICNNLGDGSGAAFECDSLVSGTIVNSVFWNNGLEDISVGSDMTVQYSDIMQGYSGIGNISLDPIFRDTTAGDYHIMSIACGDPLDSPCIDVASPDYRDDTLSCQWGLGDSLCDMGAYGGGHIKCYYIPGDANNTGIANGVDIVYMVNYLKGLGPPPPIICYDCPNPGENIYAAGDVNGTCEFNGVDITYLNHYFRGYGVPIQFCRDCPPGQ